MFDTNRIVSDTNRLYSIQTDCIRYKPILSDTNRFYHVQTDYITIIAIVRGFNFFRTKVAPRTTYILLGPRCFATRGQKNAD